MVRVSDLDSALNFYCAKLGLAEIRRQENEKGRFTLVFLAAPADHDQAEANSPMVELTWNWDKETYGGGRNFGHLAYAVPDIYALCEKLMAAGVTINRPPRDGHMAFIRSPDGISIELLQEGERLPPREPWASMANTLRTRPMGCCQRSGRQFTPPIRARPWRMAMMQPPRI
jgi:lactoylglutathione lyase